MAAAGLLLFFFLAGAGLGILAAPPALPADDSGAAAAGEECVAPSGCAAPDTDAEDSALLLVRSRLARGGPQSLSVLEGETRQQAGLSLRQCFQQRPELEVFYPGDAGYNDSRRIHNFRVAHLVIPNVTVKATTREDVRLALKCSTEAGLGALAASGMNAYEAFCTEGCVLILTAGMKNFTIYPDNRTAILEPGLDNGEMYYYLYKGGGFALPSGTINIVGLAGIALGGGKGYTTRLHGLLSDHIFKVEVMLYNGTVVTASEEEHPDLLWLCRGGGGMEIPGVVVAFHFDIVKAPEVVTTLILKWNLTEKMEDNTVVPFLQAWQTHLVANEDRRLHARLEPNSFGGGELGLSCYFVGGTEAEALEVMAPFFAAPGVGMPLPVNTTKELPWLETVKSTSGLCGGDAANCPLYPPYDCVEDEALLTSYGLPENCGWGHAPWTPNKHRALVFEEPMNASGLERLVVAFSNPPFGGNNKDAGYPWQGLYMQIDPTNGKAAEMPPNATAYPWRSSTGMTMQLVITWQDNVTNNATWENYSFDFVYNLSAWAGGGASYVNYLDEHIPSGMDSKAAYWGQNGQKVVDVMRSYTTGTVTTTYWLTE